MSIKLADSSQQTDATLSLAMLKAGKYCWFARRTELARSLWQSSKEATKALGRCKRPAALIEVVKLSRSKLLIDGIFCAAALHRLSVLSRHETDWEKAWRLCCREAREHGSTFGARELAIAALATAKAKHSMSPDFLEEILSRVLPGLQLNSTALPIRYCANLLWAAAFLRNHPLPLTTLLFKEVESACNLPSKHGPCNGRDASQICWAFASSGRHVEGLRVLESLACRQGSLLDSYSDHDLATSIWAMGTMRCPGSAGRSLLGKLMDAAKGKDFKAQGLSMTLWGLASLAPCMDHDKLKTTTAELLPKVLQHAGNLVPQGASNILWALATVTVWSSAQPVAVWPENIAFRWKNQMETLKAGMLHKNPELHQKLKESRWLLW